MDIITDQVGDFQPYYQDADCVIYHADCLPILNALPAACADVLLGDPPFCSGGSLESQKNTKGQGVRSEADGFEWFAGDQMTTPGLVFLLRSVLVSTRRFLRPNRSALLWTDWRMVPNIAPAFESAGLRYRNMIVWDKGSAGLGMGFRPRHEILLEYTNGSTEYNSKSYGNVIAASRIPPAKRNHKCEKPLAVLNPVLDVCTKPDGVVVDPFMGGGSVLASAMAMGRKYFGVEIEEKYCERAAKRKEQGKLF